MNGGVLYGLTVAFSLVSGTAAGLLSLLVWRTLRQSPFGRAVLVLSLVMFTFTLYHAFVLTVPVSSFVGRATESLLFTGVAVVIWTMIWSQHRVRTSPATEVSDR